MNIEPHHSVEIGKGLGEIKFGSTTDDVERYLGEPDEAETLDPGTESTVMWFYVDEKLQIIFQNSAADNERRVVQLVTGHATASLWGTRIIGRPENEVLALFKAHGHEEFIVTSESLGEYEYKSFRIESWRVTLDFRDGLLRHVLWGKVESPPAG